MAKIWVIYQVMFDFITNKSHDFSIIIIFILNISFSKYVTIYA